MILPSRLRAAIEAVGQDARHAIRSLARSPGFTLAVVATLGLGIGANATMFGVIEHLMFRPYAYMRDPSTVHRVYGQSWDRGRQRTLWDSEYTRYLDLTRSTSSFAQTAAFTNRVMAIGRGAASREQTVAAVSASFFDFFDARPAVGRFFNSSEDVTPRGADVAVLGYRFWQTEMAGRSVLGDVLQIGTIQATIIGVAPEGFVGVSDGDGPAAFIPVTTFAGSRVGRDATTYFTAYYWRWVEIMVRRKPGVSVAEATADASRAAVASWNARRAFEPTLPTAEVARPSAAVSALKVGAGPDPSIEARTALWVAAVAAIVLLIACANVANLLLARALARQREVAVRLALGVSRGRLMTYALSESLILATLGCVAGLAIARWSAPAVAHLLTARGVGSQTSAIVVADWRLLAATSVLVVVVASLIGLLPGFVASREDVASMLRSGGRGSTVPRSRARTALLITQAALSVVLLVGAGLFVRSLRRVQAERLGYDAGGVLVATQNMRDVRLDDSARVALRRTLLQAAQAIPEVELATWAMTLPFSITNSTGLFVPGVDSVERLGRFTYQAATADYFRVMRTRIVRGRGFTMEDGAETPRVAVVSDDMARAVWPGRDPLGQCIRVFVATRPCATVVGVAENIVQDDLTAAQRLHFYLPLDQFAPTGGSTLILRMRGDPAHQSEAVRAALQRAMPGSAYVTVRPLERLVTNARRSWMLGATMFSAFGVLALIVAGVGLYGVVAYDVQRRTHELGVRVALGALSRDVIRLVVGQSAAFAGWGILIGIAIAFLASRWIEPLLFRQSARDVTIYAAVAAMIAAVTVAASILPALRASHADPLVALRMD